MLKVFKIPFKAHHEKGVEDVADWQVQRFELCMGSSQHLVAVVVWQQKLGGLKEAQVEQECKAFEKLCSP